MQFRSTQQKAYVLEANATGMNTGNKSKKFFLNLEKQRGAQNTIKKIIDQTHFRMNKGLLRGFFNITRTNNCGRNFLSRNNIPKLSHEKNKQTL